jgi:SAM-dependent methyltransferase
MPLANAFLTAEELKQPEDTWPLDVVFCPHCTLVQITETVPPEKLFRNYFYLSSFSDTALREAEKLANRLIEMRRLDATSLVVEVGSNDGYLLQFYKRAGIAVLGIEPAANIARVAAEKHGIPTVCEFFSEALAAQLKKQGRSADVIHANNVLAHVPDLNGVVRGLKQLLQGTGVAVIEVPYVRELIDRGLFDTIYHEHLCYFSLTALDRLFNHHGLIIHDLERLDIHGGTLRLYAGHINGREKDRSPEVHQLLQEEIAWGIAGPDVYVGFAVRVEALGRQLIDLLHGLKSQGSRIAIYGASAKGSTLLNYLGIGQETIEYAVDRSTVKEGHYTPGTHLKIYSPRKLLEDLPEYTLLLTWNFADEILEQQAEYRNRGGKFIIPLPEVRIV